MEKKIKLHTETVIDSSHRLIGYDGLCKNLHGHSWKVDIWVKGSPDDQDEVGIIWDFSNVKKLKDKFDHQLINEIGPFDKINPTAENLVQYFYQFVKDTAPHLEFKVRVYETYVGKKTWAEYGDWE